jgi:anti-sigma factor RsiW
LTNAFALVAAGKHARCNGLPLTLVYGRRLHLISLSAVPAAGPAKEPSLRKPIKGTNVSYWSKDGVAYVAASDLNPNELETFVRAFRAGLQAH